MIRFCRFAVFTRRRFVRLQRLSRRRVVRHDPQVGDRNASRTENCVAYMRYSSVRGCIVICGKLLHRGGVAVLILRNREPTVDSRLPLATRERILRDTERHHPGAA